MHNLHRLSLQGAGTKSAAPPPAVLAADLDPQSARVLGEIDGPGVRPLTQMLPEGARRAVEMFVSRWDIYPKPAVARVDELEVPGGDAGVRLPARLYVPGQGDGGNRPLLVFFHGGGYVVGSLASHDSFCRMLARGSGWLVLSVGYRLAPEHPFPAAHRDARAATVWASCNAASLGGTPGCLAVGGDGTGAILAAAVCQLARTAGGPTIRRQVLWYPQMGGASAVPAGQALSESYFLSNALMHWSATHYLQGSAYRYSPLLDPLRLQDFRGLPPAFIMSAGFHPARDAARRYAQRLAAAGVPVEYHCMETTIHGFLTMLGGIDRAVQAVGESAAYLKAVSAEDGIGIMPCRTNSGIGHLLHRARTAASPRSAHRE